MFGELHEMKLVYTTRKVTIILVYLLKLAHANMTLNFTFYVIPRLSRKLLFETSIT